MSKVFELKELTDQDLFKIYQRALIILEGMKGDACEDFEPTLDMAAIMAIFDVLNPENLPIHDDMEKAFQAYVTYSKKLFKVN